MTFTLILLIALAATLAYPSLDSPDGTRHVFTQADQPEKSRVGLLSAILQKHNQFTFFFLWPARHTGFKRLTFKF